MKKIILLLVASLFLVGCSTTPTVKVNLNEIPRIEKDDYIIIAFEGYNKGTELTQEAEVIQKVEGVSYIEIEKIIKDHCKKRNNKAYYTTHYRDKVYYPYGSGFEAVGQRYWCAKTRKDAKELYKKYLKNPPDEYLSQNQKRFAERSLYWIKTNKPERITEALNDMTYYAHIAEFSPIDTDTVSSSVAKKEKSKRLSSGSAFFIDTQGYLVTNFHVVKGCTNKSKIIYKHKEIEADLIAKDKVLDLALLKSDIQNDKFIRIAIQKPKKLQKVILAGHPLGKMVSDDLKVEDGIITSLKGPGDDSTLIQTNVATNFGNSGGPIVYEESGELVAVAVSGLRKDLFEGINFGIKASSVRNFLQSNRIDIATTSKKINFSKDNLVDLLESSTLYTFCKK